jgi:hypothetical protein
MSASAFERKQLPNGAMNPKYVDLLDEDPPLAGQKFFCASFISPDKILKKREQYLFDKFVDQWDFTKSMAKFSDFLHFVSYKYNLKLESVMADYGEFLKEESVKLKTEGSIEDDWKTFLDKNEDSLNQQFSREHAFQTSTRGLKIRGVFATQEEAEMRCKKLRESDPNHDITVGPMGMWAAWDPDAYKTGRVEFLEEELNQLQKEKIKNEEKAKQEFENRVKEAKKKAIEDNIAKATKTGNILTQTLDDNGNLIGVKEQVNFDEREVADKEAAEVHTTELLKKANENQIRNEEPMVD